MEIGLLYGPAREPAGGINSLESIPGLHKSFKNTASVRFTSIQFVFFASVLPISGKGRVRFDLFKFLNKQTSIRLICLAAGISRVRFASIFLISGISRGSFCITASGS